MPRPAAKQGDAAIGMDTHIVIPPGQLPTPMPMPFNGKLAGQLCDSVFIQNQPVACIDSVALNTPHVPPAGSVFQRPPTNRGVVVTASNTVFAQGRGIARNGDTVQTCNDPHDLPAGKLVSACTVLLP